MAQKYARKNEQEVEAVQWLGKNIGAIKKLGVKVQVLSINRNILLMSTLEGVFKIKLGTYIIKEYSNGSFWFYLCPEKIFENIFYIDTRRH